MTTAQKAKVENYSTLVAAETAYAQYAINALQNSINALPEVSALSTQAELKSALQEYLYVQTEYTALDETRKTQITGYEKVTAGIAAINAKLVPYAVKDMIAALPETPSSADMAAIAEAKTAYEALDADQKAVLTADEINKIESLIEFYDAEMAKVKVVLFYKGADYASYGVTVSGNYSNSVTYVYDNVTYNALKIESSTSITITVAEWQKVELYISDASARIKVDGTSYTATGGVVTIENLTEGTHSITKDSSTELFYMILS